MKNGWFGAHIPGDVDNYGWGNRRDCKPGGWVSVCEVATYGGDCYTDFMYCAGCGGNINFACKHSPGSFAGEYYKGNAVYYCSKCGCKCSSYWHDAPTDYQNAYRAGNYEDYSMRQ